MGTQGGYEHNVRTQTSANCSGPNHLRDGWAYSTARATQNALYRLVEPVGVGTWPHAREWE